MRRLLAAALFLASATAWGQPPSWGADLTIDSIEVTPGGISPPLTRAHSGDELYVNVRFHNEGPELAQNVVIDISLPATGKRYPFGDHPELPCEGSGPVHCALPVLSPVPGNNYGYVSYLITLRQNTAIDRVAATIYSATPDPVQSNNTRELYVEVSDAPDLMASIFAMPSRFAPLAQEKILVIAGNAGLRVAHHARLTIIGKSGATIIGAAPRRNTAACQISGGQATCTREELSRREPMDVEVTLAAPDRLSGGSIGVRAEVEADEIDFNAADNATEATSVLIREMRVTNTSDSGEGSLRQAFLDVNALCSSAPCQVAFRIPPPVPESGWYTIAPQTPLPPLGGMVMINGRTQTAFTGDTNPDGPEIEIRGDRLTEGDGIRLVDACEASVKSLVLDGFPGHAIDIELSSFQLLCAPATIAANIIGFDPTGKTAVANLRGIVATGAGGITILNNVIGGNRRSGIFLQASEAFAITNNRIAGNGASGIFVGSMQYGGDILDNVIVDNGEFGIARALDANDIGMHRNLIHGNGQTAIDAGLDLETANVPDDSRSTSPNRPVLLSAMYDPAGDSTIIRGRLDSEPELYFGSFLLEFFASTSLNVSGHGQAEQYLGSVVPKSGHSEFEFRAKGNLVGQWITATSSRSHIIGFAKPGEITTLNHRVDVPDNTSELSDPIQVNR